MFDRTCNHCGAQFETDAAQGLCPHCLVRTAIQLAAETPDALEPEDPPFEETRQEPQQETEARSFPEGRRLEDYELLEPIGQGGMGVVYKARQVSLNRLVAVKMLLAGEFASPTARARFHSEAEAAASLHHPNIVTVYETGESGGRLYFSMDFVEGQTLAERVRGTPLPPPQAARYARKIAAAVHYAHQKGVLHRDLKPSNVLIDHADEPRITDFGLAKRFAADAQPSPPDTELTVSGQILGSPNFMPPEQASPRRGAVGPRSDVYGLGALLYHLLTGRPPFHAATVTDTLEQVLNSDPAPPRLLNPNVPPDLETICLKCLAKEPAQRYGAMHEVAEELGRFLAGEPIRARPLGPLGRTWRWCRRKPALAILGAGVVLLTMLILVGSPIAITRIERERRRAETEATANARNLYAADVSLCFRLLAENDLGRIRDLLARQLPTAGRPDLRGWEWRYLWQESRGDQELVLGPVSNEVNAVALSPDGALLAVGASDGTISLRDARTGATVATVRPRPSEGRSAPTTLRFSPDGGRLAAGVRPGGPSSLLEVWDTANWQRVPPPLPLPGNSTLSPSALSPDLTKLATVGQERLELWDLRETRPIFQQPLDFYGSWYACSAFSRDGRFFACHVSGAIQVWDLAARQRTASLATRSPWCRCVALSPDGRLVAGGYRYESAVEVWALPEAQPVATLAHAGDVRALSFSPDGLHLASAGAARAIGLWDCQSWELSRTLRGHSDEVLSLSHSADGKWLVSASKDGTVRVWNIGRAPAEVPLVRYPADMPRHNWRAAYLGRFGDRFMLARSNGTYRVYGKSSLRLLGEYPLPVTNPRVAEIAPDGRRLACWCEDGAIRVFDTERLEQVVAFDTNAQGQRALAFSPDGRTLAACADHTMWAWDLESGAEIMKDDAAPVEGNVLTAVFSPEGRWFACALYESSMAVVWDLVAKTRTATLRTGGVAVRDVAIHPSRRYVVTVGDEDDAKLWDPATPTPIASLRGLSTYHLSVAFSPDGRRFVTGGGEYVTLWDLATRREVGVLKSPHGVVDWVEFVADDNTLLAATETGVFSWRAPSFEEIAQTATARAR